MVFENLRADIARSCREPSLGEKLALISFGLGIHAVIFYRTSSWFYRHHLGPVGFVVSYFGAVWTGCQVSGRAKIGKGLRILHPSGIVIGASAVVGKNCTLAGRNSIAQKNDSGARPTIGDDFFMGAGAGVFGNIAIGNRVRVGPNAVVMDSLPDDTTATCEPPVIRHRTKLQLSA